MKKQYEELYQAVYNAPGEIERIAFLEELIRVADSNNDVETGYEARDYLSRTACEAGYPEKGIVAFSWCLSQFDKNQELDYWHSILWRYKVILELIPIFLPVSREQIVSMQEDMARRLLENGESERTAHYYRAWNFMRMGDYELALKHQETYLGMKRDGTSDCNACERDRQVELLSRMHKDKESLKRAQPIMSGRMMCGEVPEFTNAHIVRSQLRLDLIDEAAKRAREGYDEVRDDRKYLGTIGDLLLVFVRVGDLDRAMRVVTRHLPWAVEAAADELRFRFYSGVALFFESLASAKPRAKKMRIPQQLDCSRDDDRYKPADLAAWFDGEARRLAGQFNQRNGNSAYDDLLTDNRALAGLS